MSHAAPRPRRTTSLPTVVITAVAAGLIALFVTGGSLVMGQLSRIPLASNTSLSEMRWDVDAPASWREQSESRPGTEVWALPNRHYLAVAGGPLDEFDASGHADAAVDSGITVPENDAQATQKFAWEQLGLSPNGAHHATKLEPVWLTVTNANGEELEVEFAVFEVVTATEHVLVAAHVFNASGHVLVLTRGGEESAAITAETLAADAAHLRVTLVTA